MYLPGLRSNVNTLLVVLTYKAVALTPFRDHFLRLRFQVTKTH